MESSLEKFSDNLFVFLSGSTNNRKGLLVKKHTENLKMLGDFSFPNTVKSWHGYLKSTRFPSDTDASLLKYLEKEISDLVEESKKWPLQINKAKEERCRIHVFLDRPKAIHVGLMESLKNTAFISQRIHQGSTSVQYDHVCEDNSITFLRLKCLTESIQNLYAISTSEELPSLCISSKSSSSGNDRRMVLCGAVLNAKTGAKETAVNAEDFIRSRQDEMTLIAQHKYGVRVSTDTKWKEFIAHLGESAARFELLQTKPSSAVKINFNCSAGSSKGAAFILYNCARLETILKTYNERVAEGVYPKLPNLQSTDLSLLTQEDEWTLVFNYVLGLPTLMNNCVEMKEDVCEVRPHHICNYLSCMVKVFSQYYRKVRILTEPRKHLLPVIFARIHMLIKLNDTLKICLRILNIKSVTQM